MSPNEPVENSASAASPIMSTMGPGSCDIAAPSSFLLDSRIDWLRELIRTPVTLPPRTAPSTFTANTGR
jgi:hypothetical protein